MKRIVLLLTALMFAGTGWAGEDTEGKAILDFAEVPAKLSPARLAELDGKNLTGPASRTSFWVEPGVHELVVTAMIDDPSRLPGTIVNRHVGGPDDDPGKTTIEVEAGKRYRIAAQALDDRGKWEPVVWKVEDID
ncbi:MAG: hypothetical protein PVG91_08835 [Gammaproteobacteria bacterium]|jgi:hypothetical protein